MDAHPDLPGTPDRALGYWTVPIPDAVRSDLEEEIRTAVEIQPGLWRSCVRRITVTGGMSPSERLAELERDAALPDPHGYVDLGWDAAERLSVADYLDRGVRKYAWLGWSNCRFCRRPNGTRCLTDGTFVWPEGFGHYVRAHAVRPPAEFVDHALRSRGE